MSRHFTAATITMSTRCAAGLADDASGALLRDLLAAAGADLYAHEVLPDSADQLEARLRDLCGRVDVVVTTGGTGISPTDVTPEATAVVVERRLPGVEAALHLAGRDKVPTAILSRGIAGVRGRCIIVNLPGSPGGVRDGMAVLAPILPHAVRLVRGEVRDCAGDLRPATGQDD